MTYYIKICGNFPPKLFKLQPTNFFSKCPRGGAPNGVLGPAGWNLQLHLGLLVPQHLRIFIDQVEGRRRPHGS